MKNRAVLIAVVLLLSLMIHSLSPAIVHGAEDELAAAQRVAQLWIDGTSGNPLPSTWKGAVAGPSTPCYGLNGQLNAHLFSVLDKGRVVGHMLLGSSAYGYAIIEAGESELSGTPDPVTAKNAIQKLGLKALDADVIGPQRILFTGIDGVWGLYVAEDKSVAVNLYSGRAKLAGDIKVTAPSPDQYRQKIMTIRSSMPSSATSKTAALSSVPTGTPPQGDNALCSMQYYSSYGRGWCGPCSGVSIGRYYRDERRFSGLYGSDDLMYDRLYYLMNTWFWSGVTWPWDYGPGFVAMTNECGYQNATSELNTGISPDEYWPIIAEIDRGFPSAICIWFQEAHWIAMKGYWYDSAGDTYLGYFTDSYSSEDWRILNWGYFGLDDFSVFIRMCDYLGTTALSETINPNYYVYLPVSLTLPVGDPRQIRYEAFTHYIYAASDSWHEPHGISVLAVQPGPPPFDGPINPILNTSPDPWYLRPKTYWGQLGSYACTTPVTLAEVVPILTGSAESTQELKLTFKLLFDETATQGIAQSQAVVNIFRRGDATCNDVTNEEDANYIAGWIVGINPPPPGPLNAATPKHDGVSGDRINIFDAMFIAQYKAGLRNDFFEWIAKAQAAGLSPISPSKTVVSIANADIPTGKSTTVPLTVKGIPAGSAGLGCFCLDIVFDPKVVRVDRILPGDGSFPSPQGVAIDNARGVVKLAGFHSNSLGPTGDFTLASLVVTALGKAGDSSPADVQIKTLGDSLGNNIPANAAQGIIRITSGA
ncbi:MAG: cohesin domain-containing protein [Chloroflexota bacterium]